jgi:integrase
MKLTLKTVRDSVATGKRYWIEDDALPGFRLQVSATGKKTYYVRLRTGGRDDRQDSIYKIGEAGVLTPDEARTQARNLLARYRMGDDPLAERRKRQQVPTVAELCNQYVDSIRGKRKPKTIYDYTKLIDCHIRPVLGARKANVLEPAQVIRWHSTIGQAAPTTANRALGLLSTVYRWAHESGIIEESIRPTRSTTKYREVAKERYLTEEETQRLWAALEQAERTGIPADPNRSALAGKRRRSTGQRTRRIAAPIGSVLRPANVYMVAAIRVLLLTGWREQEVLQLRWENIDRARSLVDLPDTKTGRSTRQIGSAALEVLDALPKIEGSAWVFPFPGADPKNPIREIKHLWQAVRHAAGLDDVRLHDLRHTFASAAATRGISLQVIGKLLGHKDLKSTARYAHLTDSVVRHAADLVSEGMVRTNPAAA